MTVKNNLQNTRTSTISSIPLARQNSAQRNYKVATTTKNGSYLEYDQGRKLIGTLDVRRYINIKKGNNTSTDYLTAGIKIARDSYGDGLSLKDEPKYMRGLVSLNIADLVQVNDDNKSSPLLDRIMETMIRDDAEIYTALHDNPDYQFKIHLGLPQLVRDTNEKVDDVHYKYALTKDKVVAAKNNSRSIKVECVGIDVLADNQTLQNEVQNKLNAAHEAFIYVKLDKETENIIVTGFDAKTGQQYNATISRESVLKARKKAADAAIRAATKVVGREAADLAAIKAATRAVGREAADLAAIKATTRAVGRQAADLAATKAATRAVGREVAKLAGEMQAERSKVTLDHTEFPSFNYLQTDTGIISPEKIIERDETLSPVHTENKYSVLNHTNFLEKHSHMKSDRRALLAIAALVIAGVAAEAIGGAIAGAEAADAKDDADTVEQDAIANDPNSLAIANQQAQQEYADALNAGNPDNIPNPGTNTMYMGEDGTWMVLDTPTDKGQAQIEDAQARYDADIATYNDKMSEHDKLLKKDIGKISTSLAGIFLGAAAGTAATKYIIDIAHNSTGKHDINGAIPVTFA